MSRDSDAERESLFVGRCECGHAQERHLFGRGECVHWNRSDMGKRYCPCQVFAAEKIVEVTLPPIDVEVDDDE